MNQLEELGVQYDMSSTADQLIAQGREMQGKASIIDPSHRGKVIQNPDGSTSSERTITVGMDNKYYNIPSLVNGIQLTEDEAVRRFRAGEIKAVGVADTLEEAVKRAGTRTKMLGGIVK